MFGTFGSRIVSWSFLKLLQNETNCGLCNVKKQAQFMRFIHLSKNNSGMGGLEVLKKEHLGSANTDGTPRVCLFVFYSETKCLKRSNSVTETMSHSVLFANLLRLAYWMWMKTDSFLWQLCRWVMWFICWFNRIEHSNHWSHITMVVYQNWIVFSNCHLSPNCFLFQSNISFSCNMTKNILFSAFCGRKIIHLLHVNLRILTHFVFMNRPTLSESTLGQPKWQTSRGKVECLCWVVDLTWPGQKAHLWQPD